MTDLVKFGLGFLLDTLSSNLMGLGALSYSVAGFLSGQIGAGKVTGRLGYLLILALAAVAAHTILFYFTEPWKEGGFWKLFMMPTMPRILYTWILGLFWIISPFPRFNAAKKHASAGKEL